MEEGKRDIEEYLKDLKEIRKVMDQAEDYGIIETWVYWVYGTLIIAASLLSYYLIWGRNMSHQNVFLAVWLPVFVLSGITEGTGWILRMNKLSAPLLSNRFTKLGIGLMGPIVIEGIMVYLLLHTNLPHAGIYMMAGAIPLFMYSQVTYTSLGLEGWALTAGGIILLINHVASLQSCLYTGIAVGVVYLAAGFHITWLEKKIDG